MERYVRFVFTTTLDKTSAVDAVTHLTDLLELFDHVVQNDGIGIVGAWLGFDVGCAVGFADGFGVVGRLVGLAEGIGVG